MKNIRDIRKLKEWGKMDWKKSLFIIVLCAFPTQVELLVWTIAICLMPVVILKTFVIILHLAVDGNEESPKVTEIMETKEKARSLSSTTFPPYG